MEPFLKQITGHLYRRYGKELSSLTIVFPNRRPAIFFRKYLSEFITAPVWMPRTLTINELMEDLSSLIPADEVTLITTLYEIYKKEKKTGETLDNFYYWGEVMLSDFDDIDKYLVNASDLFKNLSMLKSFEGIFDYLTPEQIEAIRTYWNHFNSEHRSRHKEEFIEVWNIMSVVYNKYRKQLKEQGIGYPGMIFREAAENTELPNGRRYVFAGFNALNKCEHKLFSRLKKNGQAIFFWDYDELYIKDKAYESGLFLRGNIRDFPPETIPGYEFNRLTHTEKHIECIAVPSVTGQAALLPVLLKDIETSSDTAIVLADESLLTAVLSAIPDTISELNITMGYPLHLTPIYSFIDALTDLQRNARKTNSGIWFWHKQVLKLINHQYLRLLYPEKTQQINAAINRDNIIYVNQSMLGDLNKEAPLFISLNDTKELPSYLLLILQAIARHIQGDRHSETAEYLFHTVKGLNRYKDIIEKSRFNLSTESQYRLLMKILKTIRIPFSGEPLKGLQVIGLMETRLLDFNRIILLSANEGTLPKTSVTPSYIPYNLRSGFGLPTIEHQDAIFAYYFYRLLQGAKHCTLIYGTATEATQRLGMSRYLYQLKYDEYFTLHEKQVVFTINTAQKRSISINRDTTTEEKLAVYCNAGNEYLSASALNTFLNCKLRFYFRYISQMNEPDQVTEDIDPATLGNLLHHAMYNIYREAGNKTITAGWINKTAGNTTLLYEAVDQAFHEIFFNNTKNEQTIAGRNIIIREVLIKYLKIILTKDEQYTPFTILSTEEKLIATIPINNKKIKIGGRIDRIDKKENIIRIVDYKTGEVKNKIKTIESLFERGTKRNTIVLQMLLYGWLYNEQFKTSGNPVIPVIYPVRQLIEESFNGKLILDKQEINNFSDIAGIYTQCLTELLTELFDSTQPYTQTDDLTECANCAYARICRR